MRALWLCVWCFPLLVYADIYRWTDAQGKVHFSETPPPGAQRIEVKPQVVERDAATREREERTRRFYDARRDEQAAAQTKAVRQQAELSAQCARWQHDLNTLSLGGRYFTKGSDGERTYYSDAQIDAARRELEARLAEGCR
ncbi:DUF4124 domain-containing protein [Pseudomonas sp. MT3]|uniref:DUF4124 domain-containing protein n=1 Tax=Pseudomonas sp. ATCC 13867 TaxID=1294143 RepID=UPI0002C4EAA8|nr:DUF4124 domain-containing protein [Pseudomonas sp. ATCC 13867]AGI25932.1 hypothetical protein H681_20325 [Pseudomonas sp. ATCC 13867]RFQ40782.1 DUF4124 domain-containing protein [Pseudomonas sp. ATCC 13867]